MLLCSCTDENDFSTTPLEVIFPVGGESDEGVPIPITTDGIDEAERQFFIAHLQLVNATSPGMIDLERVVTDCIIVDIDSEYCKLVWPGQTNKFTLHPAIVN